jgi:hypothetical protein
LPDCSPPVRLRRAASLTVAAIVLSTACRASDNKAVDTEVAVAAKATPSKGQARYSVADFSRLGWVAGDWQSRTQDGRPIYDRYRMIDDSTMKYASFSDSTFRTQKDSAAIELRVGLVIDRGNGAPWFATRIDTTGVNFESQASPTSHFVWTRVSRDHWTTQIFITDAKGTETRTVFQVERVKRQ